MSEKALRILLVDDDEKFLGVLEERCRRMGFEPSTATCVKDALDLAGRIEFRIAVVDLRLPDLDGLVAITKLKEIQPDVRTVLLTAHGDEKLKEATESLQSAYFDKAEMKGFWSFLENLPFQRLVVLLVDDDRKFLDSLASRVRLKGYEPLTAADAAEALQIARSTEVHLAVVDHRLPDMEGLVLITKLKEVRPGIEAILLTAYGSEKLREATQALNSAYSDKGEMRSFWGIFRRMLMKLEITMAAAGMASAGAQDDAVRMDRADEDEDPD